MVWGACAGKLSRLLRIASLYNNVPVVSYDYQKEGKLNVSRKSTLYSDTNGVKLALLALKKVCSLKNLCKWQSLKKTAWLSVQRGGGMHFISRGTAVTQANTETKIMPDGALSGSEQLAPCCSLLLFSNRILIMFA